MVQEKRIIFGVEDFTAIRHQCRSCKREMVHEVRLEKAFNFPTSCPFCRTPWGEDHAEDRIYQRHVRLIKTLRDMLEYPNRAINLRFEIRKGKKNAQARSSNPGA